MNSTVVTTIVSAITGTALWEGFKYFFPEIQKYFKDRREARKIINENIDPLLKTADELLAKIYSFSKTDFKDFEGFYRQGNSESKSEILYTLYLFSAFYARLSIIRRESSFINLATYKRGRNFLSFMYAFESKKNRIIPKSVQRSIGDSFIHKNGSKTEVHSILQFKQEIYNGNQIALESIKPLEEALINSKDKIFRQRIYLFGIVIQVFIDHFDSNHLIVRKREIYFNKLSNRTRNDLRFRLFDKYLTFIKNPFEYYRNA